jgi:predicted tellurium resistance membrane protein TerC
VLGIDNLVFIAILAGRLPAHQRKQARQFGLGLALLTRLALLASMAWIAGLTGELFQVNGHAVSWRDMILVGGGIFLLYKATHEIHKRMEGDEEAASGSAGSMVSFVGTVVQIMFLDIIFSLDSVITAVGMAGQLWVMIAAVIISVGIMLVASSPLADFIERHATVKMLALCFLLLIGVSLIADGAGSHLPKGYIYGAIGFSVVVETLNQLAARRKHRPTTRL